MAARELTVPEPAAVRQGPSGAFNFTPGWQDALATLLGQGRSLEAVVRGVRKLGSSAQCTGSESVNPCRVFDQYLAAHIRIRCPER